MSSYKLFHYTDASIPWDDWEAVRQHSVMHDFAMEKAFLASVERSLTGQDHIWYVLFYDQDERPVAIACLASMVVVLTIIAGPALQGIARYVRKLWPSLLYLNILFCGLPISLGKSSLRFMPQADVKTVLRQLTGVMGRLAGQLGARLMVFKEHAAEELPILAELTQFGYRQAESLDMYKFSGTFTDFDDYLTQLTAHYRYDIRRSRKKLVRAGVECVRWSTYTDIKQHYTEQQHKLYYAVVKNSDSQLERLPVKFFHELSRQYGARLSLTSLVKDGEILAFNWALHQGDFYQLLFCGMDYASNNQFDLYFNLMYSELDHAFQAGASEIYFGQTASRFKARLGCHPSPLYLSVKANGLVLQAILNVCFNFLFPKQLQIPSAHIYKSLHE